MALRISFSLAKVLVKEGRHHSKRGIDWKLNTETLDSILSFINDLSIQIKEETLNKTHTCLEMVF